jgi:ABC-type transporter Mla subunit MlaD
VVPHLRLGIARLSRGLVVYGVFGIVIAVLGLGLLLYANTRLDAAGDQVEASVEPLAATMDRTATALRDAATSAETFGTTLDRTEEAVSAAATTIISVRTNLETLESVLRTVNILGLSPLGPAADAVGGIAGAIQGLDSRLTAIADSLATNRDSLAANASSLDALGDSTAAMAERLRSGVVEDSLADVHLAILILLLVLTVWTAVPAVGALVLGIWLRRELVAAAA